MTETAVINKAGSFPVVQVPCPHFNQPVRLELPRTGVLHTTEGGWRGSFGVFRTHFAPHFVVGANEYGEVGISQLVPVGFMGAALRAHNNMVLVQIEMIGFSEETPWLPGETNKNPNPQTLDALASLMNVCREEWGIPLSHPWPDGDYGRAGHNPHRSSGKFGKVPGWFGHGDMPDPDVHWDPGNLKWSKVFERCQELEAIA
jgi:hypothetical protein